jgi:hypothetical protein
MSHTELVKGQHDLAPAANNTSLVKGPMGQTSISDEDVGEGAEPEPNAQVEVKLASKPSMYPLVNLSINGLLIF